MQSLGIPFSDPGNHDDVHFPFHNKTINNLCCRFGNWRVILLNSAVKGKLMASFRTIRKFSEFIEQFADHRFDCLSSSSICNAIKMD
jgi:hypothetical protein